MSLDRGLGVPPPKVDIRPETDFRPRPQLIFLSLCGPFSFRPRGTDPLYVLFIGFTVTEKTLRRRDPRVEGEYLSVPPLPKERVLLEIDSKIIQYRVPSL